MRRNARIVCGSWRIRNNNESHAKANLMIIFILNIFTELPIYCLSVRKADSRQRAVARGRSAVWTCRPGDVLPWRAKEGLDDDHAPGRDLLATGSARRARPAARPHSRSDHFQQSGMADDER